MGASPAYGAVQGATQGAIPREQRAQRAIGDRNEINLQKRKRNKQANQQTVKRAMAVAATAPGFAAARIRSSRLTRTRCHPPVAIPRESRAARSANTVKINLQFVLDKTNNGSTNNRANVARAGRCD